MDLQGCVAHADSLFLLKGTQAPCAPRGGGPSLVSVWVAVLTVGQPTREF